jgi:GNAT superfamily N-acetyltransferase
MRELGLPEAFEWIQDLVPGFRAAALRAGLKVHDVPLLVLGAGRFRAPQPPPGIAVRVLEAGDPALAASGAVAHIGFGHPGTERGDAGPAERDEAAVGRSARELDFLGERIRKGLTTPVVAEDADGVLATGSHQLLRGVSEIVGVATLPSARRRGLGALVTARLAADARERGARTVFLTADSDDVARMYERLGFERVGMSCIAEPA